MLAYVHIKANPAKDNEILAELMKLPEVKEAHVLFGKWDIVAKVETGSPEALGSFVVSNIRTIPGVKLTSTSIVAK